MNCECYLLNMTNNLRRRQVITFCLTWILYASSYLLRKPLGVVKSDLQTSYNLAKTDLGWLDSCFFFPYAFMQMILGNLGDKYGARLTLTVNLIIMGLSMASFGWWNHIGVFGMLLFINGSAQAFLWANCVKALSSWYGDDHRSTIFGIYGTCSFAGGIIGSSVAASLWPNCVKTLSQWYDDDNKSTMFGIFGTCVFVGGIMGTALAVQLQSIYSPDLKMIFLIPSVIVILVAVITYILLRTPSELNIVVPGKTLPKHVSASGEARNLNVFQVWRIKMVPELACTMFGMKLVRYCLYMWLPMYLNQNLKYTKSQSGLLSTSFEIGGVFGSAGIGFFIDRLASGRPRWGVFYSLIGSAAGLMFFQLTSSMGMVPNFFFLFMAGACSSGPDSIVSGSLASELGDKENAQSAVSGIINGFGSIGTVIQGPLIATVATHLGWSATFYVMIFLTLLSALAIFKAAIMHSRSTDENTI